MVHSLPALDPDDEESPERRRRILEVQGLNPLNERGRLLLNRAYAMRLSPTRAESAMAQNATDTGHSFLAQEVISEYIVDLYCSQLHLVVEVDGAIHRQQEDRDRKRERVLVRMGHSIIRFTNAKVLEEPLSVLEDLAGFCFDLHNRLDQ